MRNETKSALFAVATFAALAVVSLGFDSSCANPDQLCRGSTINRRFVPNTTTPEDVCTECVEATCCDMIGDCQGTSCANEVAATHACVLDAGRAASVVEPNCRTINLRSDDSKRVYECMRTNCDDECALPTCRLDPLVPPIGGIECDRCFAQGCCPLMNECAKNRTCLLTLQCIVQECRKDFAVELRKAAHSTALIRRDYACDGGRPPPGEEDDEGDEETNCFARCLARTFVEGSQEAQDAQCLATRINECGADVDCGRFCDARGGGDDAGADADAGVDAATDAPAD